MNDMFTRLATQAATFARISNRKTLTSRDVQFAVKMLLPGQLCTHANSEGIRAVTKFGVN